MEFDFGVRTPGKVTCFARPFTSLTSEGLITQHLYLSHIGKVPSHEDPFLVHVSSIT
jgi:hypothetical protein